MKTTPVDAIKHDSERRANIPTTERAGEEAGVVAAEPKQAQYDQFRHDFTRGRDPELYWLNKYQNDDEETERADLRVDIRSLYVHEDIQPEMLINRLYRLREEKSEGLRGQRELFGSEDMRTVVEDELERVAEYYRHDMNWKNRLIQGDSLLVMNSLLKREGMAGKVQCIYMDPPYGIKYGSNWQMRLNSRDVKDSDENVSGEPEMIKAFRDTWELGIHSYLSYLRDRLVLARELLTQSGSVFVQISDENVHLVRNIMDEVFGSENFVSQIIYTKTSGFATTSLGNVADYILWYARNKECVKIRKLFTFRNYEEDGGEFRNIELKDGTRMPISEWEYINQSKFAYKNKPDGSKLYSLADLTSQTGSDSIRYPVEFKGKTYTISTDRGWRTSKAGMERLLELKRIENSKNFIRYVFYFEDFPYKEVNNLWSDTGTNQMEGGGKVYVVQTSTKTIQRCLLMTTDPGDLVLDPTCGSGTTAYVAEQWGRRWITMDTSRIALNIAKKRLSMAVYPYYELFDKETKNIRQGFVYKQVPHITLKSLANNEPAETEILYDQPNEDKTRMRVSGPFTVETLQNFKITPPEALEQHQDESEENRLFTQRIFDHLQANGIRNGDRTQQAIFHGLETEAGPYLHAHGYYKDANGEERLTYFHIGPKFGTVSKQAVTMALREFRSKNQTEGASWLVILGFSFEDNINEKDYNLGTYQVSKVRMHDDLMQDGLLKKDRGAGSFITIGEPDIELLREGDNCHIEIRGLDIYDPIRDDVKARSVEDIAYWEMDDDYDGEQFICRSLHFCGGDKKEFEQWKKGLNQLASLSTKKKAERTLHIEFADELWDTLYTFHSEPIPYRQGRQIAVRVVSQFGEESTKVLVMN